MSNHWRFIFTEPWAHLRAAIRSEWCRLRNGGHGWIYLTLSPLSGRVPKMCRRCLERRWESEETFYERIAECAQELRALLDGKGQP